MAAPSLESLNAPRTFHYCFAHRTLPVLAAHDAPALMHGLSRNGRAFLRLHWKATCHALGIEPQPWEAIGYGPGSEQMGRVGLRYLGERTIGDFQVAFVQLPLALQVREAHFVAIAHRPGATRYLAWECTLDGGARLAEWSLTPKGPRDRRIGPSTPATSLDDFAGALDRWLRTPKPARPVPAVVRTRRRTAPAPVVTAGDGVLVGGLLVTWAMTIIVLTLL